MKSPIGLVLLAMAVSISGCTSPLVHWDQPQAPHALAPGDAKLIFHIGANSSKAILSQATFLTLTMRPVSGGESRYASATDQGGGVYTVVVSALEAGDYDLQVRLYATSEDPILLFFADQPQYIAPGSAKTINLKVYEPGTINGVTATFAILPSSIEVKDFRSGALWAGPRTLSLGVPVRLSATPLDGLNPATDQRVRWSSSNAAIVAVTDSGRVVPQKPGTATLTVFALTNPPSGPVSAAFTVTVVQSIVGTWGSGTSWMIKVIPIGPAIWEAHIFSNLHNGSVADDIHDQGTLEGTGPQQYHFEMTQRLNLTTGNFNALSGPAAFQMNDDGSLLLTGYAPDPHTFQRIFDPLPISSVALNSSVPSNLTFSNLPAQPTLDSVFWVSTNSLTASININTGAVQNNATGPVAFYAVSLEDPTIRAVYSPQQPLADWMGGFTFIQPETGNTGKWIVSGYTGSTAATGMLLVRLNADASLDTTFGGAQGAVVDSRAPYSSGFHQDQVTGKLFLQGSIGGQPLRIGRYLGEGTGDSSIVDTETSQFYLENEDSNFAYYRIHPVEDTNGQLFTLGNNYSPTYLSVFRKSSNTGSVYQTFWDANGQNFVPIDLALQADNKVLVVGFNGNQTSPQGVLVRINSNGLVDASFATGGRIDFPNAQLSGITSVHTDLAGRILLTGFVGNSGLINNGVVARFLSDGTPDLFFGTGGVYDLGTTKKVPRDLLINRDGTLVVGGGTESDGRGQAFLVKLGPDGGAMTDGPFPFITASSDGATFRSLALKPDDTVAAAGIQNTAAYRMNYAVGHAPGLEFATKPLILTFVQSIQSALSVTFNIPANQPLAFTTSDVNVSLSTQPALQLVTNNAALVANGTDWKWYLDNTLVGTGPQYNWNWVGKGLGQYIVNVNVKYAGVEYSGSLRVTVSE